MAEDFIFENFCRPMIDPTVQGYNFVNTSVYALILLILVWFFIIPFLKKQEIQIDIKFMLALLPFVVFGSAFRVLNDIGIFSKSCNPLEFGFYTFTRGIWFLTAGLAILGIFIAKKTSNGNHEKFCKNLAIMGLLISVPIVLYLFTVFKTWDGFFLVLIAAALVTLVIKFLAQIKEKDFFKEKLNVLVLGGQVLDATATIVATNLYNCGEQHPLSDSILGVNPLLFLVVKIVLALLIIHYVDKDIEDTRLRNFIKIAVIILGFATGTRDVLTLGAGTCL